MVNIIVDLLFFSLSAVFLIKMSGVVTDSVEKIADSGNKSRYAITSFLGAIATNLPELFMAVLSSLRGETYLAVGLLIGSCVSDLTLAVGAATAIGGKLTVLDRYVKKDVFRVFWVCLLAGVLMVDGKLSRIDGLGLIIIYLFYYLVIFKESSYEQGFDFNVDDKGFEVFGKIFARKSQKEKRREWLWFLGGILGLIISAEMVVRSGQLMASSLRLPTMFVGLFFMAFGASLPEVAFGVKACIKKESGMLLGNLLGSLVSKLSLILGLVVIIEPIESLDFDKAFYLALGVFYSSLIILWIFLKSKLSLSRVEGLILTLIYVLFIGVSYIMGTGMSF